MISIWTRAIGKPAKVVLAAAALLFL